MVFIKWVYPVQGTNGQLLYRHYVRREHIRSKTELQKIEKRIRKRVKKCLGRMRKKMRDNPALDIDMEEAQERIERRAYLDLWPYVDYERVGLIQDTTFHWGHSSTWSNPPGALYITYTNGTNVPTEESTKYYKYRDAIPAGRDVTVAEACAALGRQWDECEISPDEDDGLRWCVVMTTPYDKNDTTETIIAELLKPGSVKFRVAHHALEVELPRIHAQTYVLPEATLRVRCIYNASNRRRLLADVSTDALIRACSYNAAVLLAFTPRRIAAYTSTPEGRAAFQDLVARCILARPAITHHPNFIARFGAHVDLHRKVASQTYSTFWWGPNFKSVAGALSSTRELCELCPSLYLELVDDIEPKTDTHIVWAYLDAAHVQRIVKRFLKVSPMTVCLLPPAHQTDERLRAALDRFLELKKAHTAQGYGFMDQFGDFYYLMHGRDVRFSFALASAETFVAFLKAKVISGHHGYVPVETWRQPVDGLPVAIHYARHHTKMDENVASGIPDLCWTVELVQEVVRAYSGVMYSAIPARLRTAELMQYAFSVNPDYFQHLSCPTKADTLDYLERTRHLALQALPAQYRTDIDVLLALVRKGVEVRALQDMSGMNLSALPPGDLAHLHHEYLQFTNVAVYLPTWQFFTKADLTIIAERCVNTRDIWAFLSQIHLGTSWNVSELAALTVMDMDATGLKAAHLDQIELYELMQVGLRVLGSLSATIYYPHMYDDYGCTRDGASDDVHLEIGK